MIAKNDTQPCTFGPNVHGSVSLSAILKGARTQGHTKITTCVASVADREEEWGPGGPLLAFQASRVCGPCDPASGQGNIKFHLMR
jgi:hypothetical protein